MADCGAVSCLDELDRILGQAGVGEAGAEAVGDGARRLQAFRTATQDGGVGCAEAERACVSCHVRAAFIDDADHADRSANAADLEAVGAGPCRHDVADGIGERGDILDALGHRLNARGCEFETVEHGAADAFGVGSGHVFLVGGQQGGRGGADAGGHRLERGGAFFRAGLGDRGGCIARGGAHGHHDAGEARVVRGEGELDCHGRPFSRV